MGFSAASPPAGSVVHLDWGIAEHQQVATILCASPRVLCRAGYLDKEGRPPHHQWPLCAVNSTLPSYCRDRWKACFAPPAPQCLVSELYSGPSDSERLEKPSPLQLEANGDDEEAANFRQLCGDQLPEDLVRRVEEIGFEVPTPVQRKVMPVVLSGRDCIIHAQTGSGKTLAYLLPLFTRINPSRAAVQALVVVPTRELGMQVAKVARALAGRSTKEPPSDLRERKDKSVVSVMALLDGGSTSRQKTWLKADPPQLIVGTLGAISRMIAINTLRTSAISAVVIDEVDALTGAAKEGGLLGKLLTVHTDVQKRQTIFVSATVPQHNHFVRECIRNKWAKADLIHLHVSPEWKLPPYLQHRFLVAAKNSKLEALSTLLAADEPRAAIVFVNGQSEKGRRAGDEPVSTVVASYLSGIPMRSSDGAKWDPLILEEDANINARTFSLAEFREGRCLLVATDIAARGLDLPEVSHIYNFDLPANATDYVHRAGRSARRPLYQEPGIVTSIITDKERFVVERLRNELLFQFQELETESSAS